VTELSGIYEQLDEIHVGLDQLRKQDESRYKDAQVCKYILINFRPSETENFVILSLEIIKVKLKLKFHNCP